MLVGTRKVAETNEQELIALMINRSIEQIYHKDVVPLGETLLETRHLGGFGFSDVSLTVRAGEIVGLYGLIGAGRSEFASAVFGRHPAHAGEILWQGRPVRIRTERDAIRLGLALAPESRRDQGLCLNLDVGLNLNLPIYDRLSNGLTIALQREREAAEKQIHDLRIKTTGRAQLALSLSGGNQQKLVIGKWLNRGAKLFIFDEPTVGVDVGTKAEIYRLFGELLAAGAGILMISSYLPEVYELADQLHVFRAGRQVASHGHRAVGHEQILTEAIGA
jgi:ribose transport system ATP-binding protein